ncbi:subclass B3 metallo-beta-lactamase [Sphingomonas sp. CFBP8993]|uniref:subclass B3 metallo-beta-lactamase n=1 Tax=Sphingomonas sp. CFBP8993 TaxID=3096526 RepID=UPI002A6B3D68|nr:subclass B3 metallo-beta-lactamase [Sphingomonas sp. CFBP8993]MDY0958759.1 subclass B3 metallo-beta-lactamase [Sphingomonas sp. CFBP8993]
MHRHLATLTACALALTAAAPQRDDPLTRPIVTDHASEWLAPRPPVRVFGDSYLVGFGGLNVALIDTGAGLILIDGALPQGAHAILANVARLGFRPTDIKYILSTEPHFDHAGGIAALARDTGATVVASPRGAEGLRTGRLAADDPQRGYDSRFPPVRSVRVIRDGERLTLGHSVVTARATPGHTMGSMSWSWRACEGKRCKSIVFASSLNPVSTDDYRFSAPAHAPVVAAFARGQAAMRALPCDILITAHADQDGATDRFRTTPGACRAYADASRQALARRLSEEAR